MLMSPFGLYKGQMNLASRKKNDHGGIETRPFTTG